MQNTTPKSLPLAIMRDDVHLLFAKLILNSAFIG